MNDDKQKEIDRRDTLMARNMAQITAKILILSNKGGVGKSFIAVNIAAGLARLGAKVGLLDADIHGPSVAKLLGFEGQPPQATPGGIIPFQINPNLVAFSMAALLENPDMPVIWRGPLKMGVLRQFLAEVYWGKLDYLVIDSPPGTGDEPLSVCQMIHDLTGAIIVTTPQDIALLDTRKCVRFLKQLTVPVLGIIENMSGLNCPHCGGKIDLFKTGGGEKTAREMKVHFLGSIPLDARIVETMDNGRPFVEAYPEAEAARILKKIYRYLDERVRGNCKKNN